MNRPAPWRRNPAPAIAAAEGPTPSEMLRAAGHMLQGETKRAEAAEAALAAAPDLSRLQERILSLEDRLAAVTRERDQNAKRIGELEVVRDGLARKLDEALRDHSKTCGHAAKVAELRVQLYAMQRRLDELQAANQTRDTYGGHVAALIPDQPGPGRL